MRKKNVRARRRQPSLRSKGKKLFFSKFQSPKQLGGVFFFLAAVFLSVSIRANSPDTPFPLAVLGGDGQPLITVYQGQVTFLEDACTVINILGKYDPQGALPWVKAMGVCYEERV